MGKVSLCFTPLTADIWFHVVLYARPQAELERGAFGAALALVGTGERGPTEGTDSECSDYSKHSEVRFCMRNHT